MSRKSAHQFVERMKMDQEFRQEVAASADTSAFQELLHHSGYDFAVQDLVGVMACCMEEMDRMHPRQ